VIVVVKNSSAQVAASAPAWHLAGKIPTYFHRVSASSGFILLIKASTVRQRWKSGEEPK
jgi:hypothetical protein